MHTTTQAPAQASNHRALIEAASAALPVGSLDAQAFGSRTAWGSHTRPGRIDARRKALRVLERAAVRAMEHRPELGLAHIVAALRSLAIHPADLLIDPLSGKWMATPAAVRNRGEEIGRALAELALIVKETEAAYG